MKLSINQLDFENINPKIKHLDKESIVDMINEYYEGESVTKLKEKYKVNVTSSQFIYLFPYQVTKEHCYYCNVKLVKGWKAKNSLSSSEIFPFCPNCGHQNHAECRCDICEEARKEVLIKEEKRKKDLIQAEYCEDNYAKKKIEELSLEDKLFLSVLIKEGLDENLEYIKPINTLENKLTPTNSFTIELIKTLAGRGLIVPHSKSSIEAFVDDDSFPNTYYIDRVLYRININSSDNSYYNMIERLMYPTQEEFETDPVFCYNMWKKIAINESIEYLLYSLNKVGFDFSPGEKTYKVFENLLNHYSVAQIYSIIYRAVANSTKLYQEKRMPKKRAANAVITSCENFGERAIAEGWNLSKFRRDYNLPETGISKTFFTSILKISFMGFEEKPTHI